MCEEGFTTFVSPHLHLHLAISDSVLASILLNKAGAGVRESVSEKSEFGVGGNE